MIQESKDLLLFSTTGSSMFPFIRWNEQILVKKVPPEKVGIADVILFQSDKGIKVCHRIVKIEDKDGTLWFQAKGDRNKFYDDPFSQQVILGEVIAIKRKMHLIELYTEGWRSFLYKFDCFIARCIFLIKKILAKIISFLQQCTKIL